MKRTDYIDFKAGNLFKHILHLGSENTFFLYILVNIIYFDFFIAIIREGS